MSARPIEFPLSIDEIDRRREAYTRLVTFTALGSLVSSIDLLVRHPALVVGSLLCLFALLLLSRAFFMKSLARYARTVWTLSGTRLMRADERSRDEHELGDIERIQVKRTVSGDIRAIGIDLRRGRALYVNALRTPQAFLDELVSRNDRVPPPTEVREPIDFDHPWFYRLLGLGIGVGITSAVRITMTTTTSTTRWLYLGVGVYMVGFGAYWLHGMPISQSYGERRRIVDMAVGLVALCVGIGLGIVALIA